MRGIPGNLAVAVLFGLVALPPESHAQAIAYVRGTDLPNSTSVGDHGNGVLFNRADACFAVTPLHVLWNETRGTRRNYAQLVVARVRGPSIPAQADLCAVVPEMDLALLRVTGVSRGAECGGPLLGAPATDALLADNTAAWVGTATEAGQIIGSALVKRAISSGDAQSFYASPAAAQDRLTEGMSGSLVTIREQPVGLLLSVSNRRGDPNAGAARIVRMDAVATRVAQLFSSRTDAETVNASCFVGDLSASKGASRTTSDMGPGPVIANLAAASCGARPIAWSIAPSSEENRPENLVGTGKAGLWRARGTGEITVDVRLCGSPSGTVKEMTLDTSGCHADPSQEYEVEALVRNGPKGSFATLSFGRLPSSGRLNLSSGAPLKGDEVRLRFVPSNASTSGICLAPLVVR